MTDTPTAELADLPPLSIHARTLARRVEQLGPAALLDQLLTEVEAARVLVALSQPATDRRVEALAAIACAGEQLEHARAELAADFPVQARRHG